MKQLPALKMADPVGLIQGCITIGNAIVKGFGSIKHCKAECIVGVQICHNPSKTVSVSDLDTLEEHLYLILYSLNNEAPYAVSGSQENVGK